MYIIGRLEIASSALEASGDFADDCPADTRLSGTVEVAVRHANGSVSAHLAHMDLIQVDNDNLTAKNDWLDDDIDRVCGLEGDARPQTCVINGKHYVFYIIPFAE